MFIYLLQDWVFLRAGPGPATLVQSEQGWLDIGPAGTIWLWAQFADIDNGGVSGLSLVYETSPLRDDAFFAEAASVLDSEVTGLMTPQLRYVDSTLEPPPGSWLRWKVEAPSVDVTWSLGFRIFCAADRAPSAGTASRLLAETGKEATRDGITSAAKRGPASKDIDCDCAPPARRR